MNETCVPVWHNFSNAESDWILPHFLLHKVYAPPKTKFHKRMLNYGLFQDSKFLVTRSTILLVSFENLN